MHTLTASAFNIWFCFLKLHCIWYCNSCTLIKFFCHCVVSVVFIEYGMCEQLLMLTNKLVKSYTVIIVLSETWNEWCDEFDFLGEAEQCGGFLCGGRSDCSLGDNPLELYLPPNVIVLSLIYIMTMVGTQHDLASVVVPVLERNSDTWGSCLDRRQVTGNACNLRFPSRVEHSCQRKITSQCFSKYIISVAACQWHLANVLHVCLT